MPDEPILTTNGLTAIYAIKPGDELLAQQSEPIKVRDVVCHSVNKLIIIEVSRGIWSVCSAEHLFYDAAKKAFIRADQLTAESRLLTRDGQTLPVISIEEYTSVQLVEVYDLILDSPHTFFCSKDQVLTHNMAAALAYLPTIAKNF